MIKTHTHKSITWIEVENPTVDEIKSLARDYNINLGVAMELELPSYKEKIIAYKDYLYVVMHFPALRHSHIRTEQEIDFIIGKNFIITTRYETIDALEKFSKTFELNKMLERDLMEDHAGFVFYYIIKELYRAMSDEFDSVSDVLRTIEKNVFSGKEKDMVADISKANRNLINIARTVNAHGDLLQKLKIEAEQFFGKDFSDNMDKILNEYYRVEKILTGNIDYLREIRATNDSLLSSKQNETMKVLTVITLLTLPMTVINGFFQLSTRYTPLVGRSHDWQIIVISELVAVILFYVFIKFKKWL